MMRWTASLIESLRGGGGEESRSGSRGMQCPRVIVGLMKKINASCPFRAMSGPFKKKKILVVGGVVVVSRVCWFT